MSHEYYVLNLCTGACKYMWNWIQSFLQYFRDFQTYYCWWRYFVCFTMEVFCCFSNKILCRKSPLKNKNRKTEDAVWEQVGTSPGLSYFWKWHLDTPRNLMVQKTTNLIRLPPTWKLRTTNIKHISVKDVWQVFIEF